jgi:hypothetical protein
MAYPTIDKPYGLKPVNLIGGQVFAGSTRLMEIATTANVGYGTDIFYGDLVKRVTGGTIEKDTGTTTATPSGVFLGCQFTNASTGQFQQQVAICLLFRMRVQPSRVTRLLRCLVPALNTTSTLPIRVIDVVRDTATGADAFVELIVKINIGTHQYTNSTGV